MMQNCEQQLLYLLSYLPLYIPTWEVNMYIGVAYIVGQGSTDTQMSIHALVIWQFKSSVASPTSKCFMLWCLQFVTVSPVKH